MSHILLQFSNKVADGNHKRVLSLDEKMAARNVKADFAYLSALWAPSADEEAYRMTVDWNHWVGNRMLNYETIPTNDEHRSSPLTIVGREIFF